SDSYEMRMLASRASPLQPQPQQQLQQLRAPFQQSPLAQTAARPITAELLAADDGLDDSLPSYDPDTAVPSASPEGPSPMGKSLPGDVDYSADPLLVPFSINNVLLRGMKVSNTDWVVGIVMYTGRQTKIVLNSGPPPFKRSRIERTMNIQVMLSFVFVFVGSFIVALVGGLRYAAPEQRHSIYVDSSMSSGLYGFALFWSAMIMLQNVIPIALYVSIEFVKGLHAYWIYEDINMYYKDTNQRCVARNWNISDDLGQVSYIFSDKTGTLTRNVMDFRMCSINGIIYGKQLPGDELDVVKGRMAQEEVDRNNPPEGGANPFFMEIQDDSDSARFAAAPAPLLALEQGRVSSASSVASNGSSQYDSSPLISSGSGPAAAATSSSARARRAKKKKQQQQQQLAAPAIPAPVPIDASRSRARTEQSASEEEIQARRRQMIRTYLSAMRNVFDPVYVEIGDEETGDGGAYTFVDPQLFYDMRPEVAPSGKVKGLSSPRTDAAAAAAAQSGGDGGLKPPAEDGGAVVRRIASHRSVNHGFDVDPARQRDAIDLFLTELATCHSVMVEKSFQKQLRDDENDDHSTIRRLARKFHTRSGSRMIANKVRHFRDRSRHHRRNESTASSVGEGIEWVPSDGAAPGPGGHARNSSLSGGGHTRNMSSLDAGHSRNLSMAGTGHARNMSTVGAGHARNMSLADAGDGYSMTAPSARTQARPDDVRQAFPLQPLSARSAADGEVPGFFGDSLDGGNGDSGRAMSHSQPSSPLNVQAQLGSSGGSARDLSQQQQQQDQALTGSQLMSPATPERKDASKIGYSAESPDEGALVRAAKNFGYTFLGRLKGTLYLDVRGERRQYEVLDTIEFDSARKRMSTVLRRPAPHNDVILFSKGADNVMIERLCRLPSSSEDPGPLFETREEVGFERAMRERTFAQIDEFANAGLRTLLLCYRKLTESEWVRWSARYHAAQASLDSDREERIAQITEEMERDLRIAGATAIEDKLQERVPETIASLRAAGIRIWVLTGDKMETAINIGFAANLLTKEMELWTISSSSGTDKIISRFQLIARIMRSMAANTASAAAGSKAGGAAGLGLDADDARALGSVSYKIGRSRKFLNISETLRQRRQRKRQAPAGLPTTAGGAAAAAAADGGGGGGDELSPDEVQQSINFLRRHSSIGIEGVASDEGGERSEYQPLNALVIDGGALSIVMGDPECRAMLLEIAPLFKSVVCCRASPLQKAEVVSLVKDGLNLVTLAIGDGANDVSMIQTADIGVAIAGEEGLQAAMASDYTFGRFHFLQNLLLVHGLYDYLRMSEMILSFFYKNVIWAMVPFWFGIYCSFSANVFYDLSYIQLYNVVFTVAPVVILGCADKPFNYKTAMTYVAVYTDGIRNRYFQWWRYVLYVVDGIYQSMVIFFTFYLFTYTSDVQNANGRTWGRSDLSTGPTVAVVIAASLCVGFNSWQWNWIMATAIGLSIAVCLVYIAVSSAVRYYSLEGVATVVMSTVQFWFGVPLAVVVALLPRYIAHSWQKLYRPRDLDIIREIKVLHRPWYGQVFVDPETRGAEAGGGKHK
ncbi:hypothetical protein H4R18_002209, partial [Coemansia javaensis]